MITAEKPIKERPILFRAPMIRALLEGKKTQTRRIVKPQPVYLSNAGEPVWSWEEGGIDGGRWLEADFETIRARLLQVCPYGQAGNRLWVRETLWVSECGQYYARPTYHRDGDDIYYDVLKADGSCVWGWNRYIPTGWDDPNLPTMYDGIPHLVSGWSNLGNKGFQLHFYDYGATTQDCRARYSARFCKRKSSLYMPRWAGRITLELTDVRVERLHDLTDADARKEGFPFHPLDAIPLAAIDPVQWYESLWDSINGKTEGATWESNPFVYALTFRRVEEAV